MLGAERIPETAGNFIGNYGCGGGIIGGHATSAQYQGNGFPIVCRKQSTAGMVRLDL